MKIHNSAQPSNSKCKPTFNIYFYDASKTVVEKISNHPQSATTNELKICNNLTIEFAKVVASWLDEEGEEMKDFVAVKPKTLITCK